jgi:hypothetical protein
MAPLTPGVTGKRRIRFLVPGLALAAAIASAPPAVAAGGANGGSNFACAASAPTTGVTQGQLTRVASGGNLQCWTPGANAPGQFGPPTHRYTPQPPTPGTPCNLHYEFPVDFRLAGSTPQSSQEGPPAAPFGQRVTLDPNNPGFRWSGWQALNDFGAGIGQYQAAGTEDVYAPFDFKGTWNNQGQCEATQAPGTGWVEGCNGSNTVVVNAECFDYFDPPAPVVAGPTGVGALGIDLTGLVTGLYGRGQIASIPDNPNPGLTQVGTCFTLTGLAVANGGDPLGTTTWQTIVQGPQLAGTEGRHVYYTLVIQSSYTGTDWNWGDDSPGTPDASVPGQCGQVPQGGVLVAHTYRQYSGARPFPVTATRHYTVDVTELWVDANGPHEADMPNAVGPLDITALNQPYPKQVIQEEGVPVS